MPTPQFITDLRAKIGSDMLWLSGATAVIQRDNGDILLVRRSDTGATCLREAEEEAGVIIEVVGFAQLKADPPMTFDNGDRCQFLDHTFYCRHVSGQARVNDEESSQVQWVPVEKLADYCSERMLDRIDAALHWQSGARFDLEAR